MANIKRMLRGYVVDEREKNWTKEYAVREILKHKTEKHLDHPDGSVTTAKICDKSVTREKLADEVLERIDENTIDISALRNDLGEEALTRIEVDKKKADKATTLSGYGITDAYTKKQVDAKLNIKADKTEIPTKVSEFLNDKGYITEHQDISGKADKSTTLSGYGITDAYTKEEVDDFDFLVNITARVPYDEENDVLVNPYITMIDKTYDEILQAYNSNKKIRAKLFVTFELGHDQIDLYVFDAGFRYQQTYAVCFDFLVGNYWGIKSWLLSMMIEKVGDTSHMYISELPLGSQDITSLLNGKVDKIEGKGLSTNDFTDKEKQKLAELTTNSETLAEVKTNYEILKYYGDINIIPTDTSYFSFTTDNETMTASISLTDEAKRSGSLEDIVIPYKYINSKNEEFLVTDIADNAFDSSPVLSTIKSIIIPNSVISIGNKAFWLCDLLSKIKIPDSVTSIGDNAFGRCNFSTLTITCTQGSFADEYAKATGIKVKYNIVDIDDALGDINAVIEDIVERQASYIGGEGA